MTAEPGAAARNGARRAPPDHRDLLAVLNELRSACQDVTGRSIRASAEANQWRARLAMLHGSALTAGLAAAYHQRAAADAAHWRLVRHQWACRYAATATDVMRIAGSDDRSGQRPPVVLGGSMDWGSVTLTTCPALPEPDGLATESMAEQRRIAQAHQVVTEAADAAGLLDSLSGKGDVPLDLARAAGELTDRLLGYAGAVHAAARRRLTPPLQTPRP